jgi:hypothetical protein
MFARHQTHSDELIMVKVFVAASNRMPSANQQMRVVVRSGVRQKFGGAGVVAAISQAGNRRGVGSAGRKGHIAERSSSRKNGGERK